jgi:TetR/AcrR family transcriptional regulator
MKLPQKIVRQIRGNMTQISASSENLAEKRSKTRIQKENETRILLAALEVFSENGFRGATLDRIAATAKMSKPNLLYYFKNKEEIHVALLTDLLDVWLAPLREISPHGEPADEIGSYIRRKLESSRQFPRESRLFANEMLAGAPHIGDFLQSELKQLVDEKAAIFQGWINEGRLAPCDPRHLLFAIWSTTQHYADFSVQIKAVTGKDLSDPAFFESTLSNIQHIILGGLKPA